MPEMVLHRVASSPGSPVTLKTWERPGYEASTGFIFVMFWDSLYVAEIQLLYKTRAYIFECIVYYTEAPIY